MDTGFVKDLVQDIIDKNFSTSVERGVLAHENRLNFRCPYCKEGRTKTKKRGNIYFDKLLYVCFRCGKKTTLDKFCKDFDINIEPDRKLEIIEHLNSRISYKDIQDDIYEYKLDKLLSLEDIKEVFNSGKVGITDFNPIKKGGYVHQYLMNRGISENLCENIWEAKHWLGSERWESVLIILNRKGDKILGAQMRNLKDGKKRTFKIFNYESLWKSIHDSEEVDIDLAELVIYNQLSYFFNILNVDFGDVITIFEGYLDSLFYPNSIGVVGVSTNMKFLESNELDLQYFYDNDEAGFNKSETKIKAGYPVFLWKKLLEGIVESKNVEDPYQLMWRINKVKDLNRLAELVPNPYQKLNLESFFSKDVLDLRWIPKVARWTKWKKTI
jgi:DNA-directed RNA polymerase subunit RPC12/RpoP